MSEDGGSVTQAVVFYDCCVPWGHIREVVVAEAPFADHLFVRDIFPQGTCNNDTRLFDNIVRAHKASYPHRACFLVTSDRKFFRRAQSFEAVVSGRITVIRFKSVSFKDRAIAKEKNLAKAKAIFAQMRRDLKLE